MTAIARVAEASATPLTSAAQCGNRSSHQTQYSRFHEIAHALGISSQRYGCERAEVIVESIVSAAAQGREPGFIGERVGDSVTHVRRAPPGAAATESVTRIAGQGWKELAGGKTSGAGSAGAPRASSRMSMKRLLLPVIPVSNITQPSL